MIEATYIIRVKGNDEDTLTESLIEVVKNLVNENGACGTGRRESDGAEFEFSMLYTDRKARRGQMERFLKMSDANMDLVKSIIEAKNITTLDEEAKASKRDDAERERINAENNQRDKKADRKAALEALAADIAETLFSVLTADSKAKGKAKE